MVLTAPAQTMGAPLPLTFPESRLPRKSASRARHGESFGNTMESRCSQGQGSHAARVLPIYKMGTTQQELQTGI